MTPAIDDSTNNISEAVDDEMEQCQGHVSPAAPSQGVGQDLARQEGSMWCEAVVQVQLISALQMGK
jgi:hypothetical protein